LPDHLSRFGVRAARTSLEAFLGSIGSPCFPLSRSLSGLRLCEVRICLHLALHPWTWTTIATRRLPSCVTPSLTYYRIGSRGPPPSPEGPAGFTRSASPGSVWAVLRRYGNINPLSIDY